MNVYRFVSTPKKRGEKNSAWQIRCWMEPNFIIRKAQRQAGNICFPAVIYRNDKVLVNWMAAGGTLDCSTICLLLPLHKIPRHTAVKKKKKQEVAQRAEPHELVVHPQHNRDLSLQGENSISFSGWAEAVWLLTGLSASSPTDIKVHRNLCLCFLNPFCE